jgi:SAM-dependent methyltransferase
MNHADHLDLLRGGVPAQGGVWADMGAGSGAFTLALAELIGPTGVIFAIDKDRRALRTLETALTSRYPGVQLNPRTADFARPLDLPPLDGIIMANSLHFLKRAAQETALRSLHDTLKPGGRLLLVAYDTDRGNRWVPYPSSFASFKKLAGRAGFIETTLLRNRPSSFLGQIYSACSLAKEFAKTTQGG